MITFKQLKAIQAHLRKEGVIEKTDTVDCKVQYDSTEYASFEKSMSWNYYLHKNQNTSDLIATFSLVEMPGCSGILVSVGSYIYEPYRNCGLGTILNGLRIQLAKQIGASLLLCTSAVSNKPQRAILDKNGWEILHQFTNKHTSNTINLDCRRIK
jgi:hypothetical protein